MRQESHLGSYTSYLMMILVVDVVVVSLYWYLIRSERLDLEPASQEAGVRRGSRYAAASAAVSRLLLLLQAKCARCGATRKHQQSYTPKPTTLKPTHNNKRRKHNKTTRQHAATSELGRLVGWLAAARCCARLCTTHRYMYVCSVNPFPDGAVKLVSRKRDIARGAANPNVCREVSPHSS